MLCLFLVFFILEFFSGCAAQGPPKGGPIDKTGPRLVSTSLENNSTNFSNEADIIFVFDELIIPQTAKRSFTITPVPQNEPEIKIKKAKIIIHFIDSLSANTTYTINFGRNIQDYRKNVTGREIKLAFSTGDSIDLGVISGNVFQIPKKHKTYVWCWKKADVFPDTLLETKPDYVASVNDDGSYRIENLSQGEYRLIAISSDKQLVSGLLGEELLGLPETAQVKIEQRKEYESGIDFYLDKIEHKQFNFQNGIVSEFGIVELVFNHQLGTKNTDSCCTIIPEELAGKILSSWVIQNQSKQLYVLIDGLSEKDSFRVAMNGIEDENGQILDGTILSNWLEWQLVPDTLQPKFEGFSSSHQSKKYFPDTKIFMNCSEPVFSDSLEKSINLSDSDSLSLDFNIEWLDGNTLQIIPREKFESAKTYFINIKSYLWKDAAGNRFADSLLYHKFTVVDREKYGSVSGQILADESIDLSKIIIQCTLDSRLQFSKQSRVDLDGSFLLDELLPGEYLFNLWIDRNNNNKFDRGFVSPFTPAEKHQTFQKKITVRSRWETAGVEFSL